MRSDIGVGPGRDFLFRLILLLGVIAAGVAFVSFGIAGVGRTGSLPFADVPYWFLSADMWLQGANPYDRAAFLDHAASFGVYRISTFAYPPTAFWLGAPLQLLNLSQSKALWIAINLLALAAIFAGSLRMLAQLRPGFRLDPRKWEFLAILVICTLGSPYAINVMWTGQTALIITALLMWSWILSHERSEWAAGFLLAMATAKPQLAILLGLWLLIDRRWTTLFAAAIASLLLMSVPLVNMGPGIFIDWLHAMGGYMNEPAIAEELSHNLNLGSAAIGLGAPRGLYLTVAGVAVGLLGTGILWAAHTRSRLPPPVPFGILVPLSLLAFYGRDYDLAACAGLLVLGLHYSEGSRSRQALLLFALFALYVPHRLIQRVESSWLIYWRPVVLLMVTGILMSWIVREYRGRQTAGVAGEAA